MKYLLLFFLIFISLSTAPSFAQKQKKKTHPQVEVPPQPPIPLTPKMVAVDAPPPPTLSFDLTEIKFGSQSVSVQSCIYVKITNTGKKPVKMTGIYSSDRKNYSIPSPSLQMFPMTLNADLDMTISVCFKPEKLGEFNSNLIVRTEDDSIMIPITGKGITAEDVAKLPKNELVATKSKKKKGEWNIQVKLINPSKITVQLFDILGNVAQTYYNGANKPEGVYEATFDGLNAKQQKLPPGKYYVRCIIEDPLRNTKETMTKIIKKG
jgi:hypothetical protein